MAAGRGQRWRRAALPRASVPNLRAGARPSHPPPSPHPSSASPPIPPGVFPGGLGLPMGSRGGRRLTRRGIVGRHPTGTCRRHEASVSPLHGEDGRCTAWAHRDSGIAAVATSGFPALVPRVGLHTSPIVWPGRVGLAHEREWRQRRVQGWGKPPPPTAGTPCIEKNRDKRKTKRKGNRTSEVRRWGQRGAGGWRAPALPCPRPPPHAAADVPDASRTEGPTASGEGRRPARGVPPAATGAHPREAA